MQRKDFSSWLQGPPQLNSQEYPGQHMGRPDKGPGSIARLPRRLGALVVDWGLSMLISWWLFNGNEWLTLALFGLGQLIGVGLTGHTIGHRLFGMQVQGLDGKPVNLLQGLIRAVLLCLFIPAVIGDQDQRGFHDRLAKSILVNIR